MKQLKIILLVQCFLLISCEQKFDNIIDNAQNNYNVIYVKPIDTMYFKPNDSSIVLDIKFNNNNDIRNVYCIVLDPNKTEIAGLMLYDNGIIENKDSVKDDLIYSNYFLLSQKNESGRYEVRYFVKEYDDQNKLVTVQYFYYFNNTSNYPPIIYNLVLKDSVERLENFVFSIQAEDSNGLANIKIVYFELFRPDGSQVIDTRTGSSKFLMDDTGNILVYGDMTANDGIYSFKNSFSSTAQLGQWKFTFRASDRGGYLSNLFEKEVVVY